MRALSSAGGRISPTFALDSAPNLRRLLYVFTYLACLIAVQILHLAMDDLTLNLGFSAGLAAGFTFSYFLEARYRALTIYLDSAVAASLAVYYFLQVQRDQSMYGNYMGILLGILMVSLAFKSFAPGDFRFLLIPCTVSVMFSSVASYDLKFMLLLPVFLVFAGFALYISNQVELALRVSSTTGGELGLHFTVDRSFFWQMMRVILGIITLSVAVHIVVPHSSQVNRSLILNSSQRVEEDETQGEMAPAQPTTRTANGQAEVGLGDDFDLSSTGELTSDPLPVLRVKASRNGYLRAQTYDVFTGSGWVQSPWLAPISGRHTTLITPEKPLPYQIHTEAISTFSVPLVDFPSPRFAATLYKQQDVKLAPDNIFSLNDTAELSYEIVRQEITLLEPQPAFYFAIFQPFRIENISLTKGDHLLDQPMLDRGSCLRADELPSQHPRNFGFTMYSLEPKVGPGKLKQVYVAGPEAITTRYTQLPMDAAPSRRELRELGIEPEQYRVISQRLRNFAVTLASSQAQDPAAALSIWDKVQAIYDYLKNEEEFTYTRGYEQLNPNQEVTEAFVMGSKEGYCRYFASSMAVLCRLNGIASRVVTGYSPGTFSLVDNAYIVKASNAHAWVEVYFDEYGWVTFDPTPASQDVVARGSAGETFTGVIDFLQELFVLDPAGTQKTILAALASILDMLRRHWQLTALAALLLVIAAAVVFGLRLLPRKGRGSRIVPQNRVVALYLAQLAELARIGVAPEIAQTPRSFMLGSARRLGSAEAKLVEFMPVFERAAYSREPQEEEGIALGEQALAELRTHVEAELARRKKK